MKSASVLLLTLWSPLLHVVGPTLATFLHIVERVSATRLRLIHAVMNDRGDRFPAVALFVFSHFHRLNACRLGLRLIRR